MGNDDLASLKNQLAVLRRRLVFCNVLIVVVIVVYLWSSSSIQPTLAQDANTRDVVFGSIKSQKIEIVNANGDVRGIWETNSEDEVQLSLFDKNRAPKVMLAVKPDGFGIVSVKEPKGEGTVSLQFQLNGPPAIIVADSRRLPRVQITLLNGSPAILLGDRKGDGRVVLGLGASDLPMLYMSDSKNERLINIGVTASDRPFITLNGPDGRGFLGMGISGDYLPVQSWVLDDPQSKLTLQLKRQPERSLILSDSAEKELWKVP